MSSSTLSKEKEMFAILVLWNTLLLPPEKIPEINIAVELIKENKERYLFLHKKTGIHWKIIGTIHYMEASCDFNRQLFNGGYWNVKTEITPRGFGPWGSWEESTVEFIKFSSFQKGDNLYQTLKKLESHNGLGYKFIGVNSPYLWSYSNHYDKGKFTIDGVYDPDIESKQVGAAVLLKLLKYSTPIQMELPL